MLAIDTNLVVRYLVADHAEQAGRARAVIDGSDVFVCVTVVLETEWVLRSAYGFSPDQCVAALAGFAGLPRVTVENGAAVAKALGWVRQGLDLAAALHLAKSEGCEAFISFDRGLAKSCATFTGVTVRAP